MNKYIRKYHINYVLEDILYLYLLIIFKKPNLRHKHSNSLLKHSNSYNDYDSVIFIHFQVQSTCLII